MNDKQSLPPPAGFNLGDIYFVVFRHKWKIIICSALGILAAVIVFLLQPTPYRSQAELFVRYVLDTKPPNPNSGETHDQPQVQRLDNSTANIIVSESKILLSLDIVNEVVDAMGAEKILAKAGGGNDRNRAAVMIKKNLMVEVPKLSSVMQITFQHPDPSIVQPVLTQLIASYLKKHMEIHRAAGLYDEFLQQQMDTARSRLAQTEEELRKAKNKVGVTSLDEAQKTATQKKNRFGEELSAAVTELAERQATAKEMEKFLPAPADATATELGVPVEKVNEYKRITARLDYFRKTVIDLTTKQGFRDDAKRVQNAREQVEANEKLQKALEDEYPKLATLDVPMTRSADSGNLAIEKSRDLSTESTRIMALQARTNILSSQLQEALDELGKLNEAEGAITTLQRKKELEDSQYRYLSSSLETARFDEALGAGKIPISVSQTPSPPAKAAGAVNKVVAMVAGSGVALGIGLAFLIELLLDRTLRRPAEVEGKLRLPLILSIPDTQFDSRFRLRKMGKQPKLLSNGRLQLKAAEAEAAAQTSAVELKGNGEVPPWEPSHQLRPFYEALRDRLVTNFEVRNLTHKPKLVAVTGCSKGSGVTSIAAGLAATLSETGDGNVLLVDMNLDNGAAHPFFKGKPACNLADLLEYQKDEKRDSAALVRENLYVATEGKNSDKLPRILPKRFTSLVPKLKASDYDYIIFDMPAVSQTSVTPRLAGFMDMVLLVVEGEKTDREIAQRASALLHDSKAYVNVVFNKTRTYIPARLHQEFLEGI